MTKREKILPLLSDLTEIMKDDRNEGFCLSCGAHAFGVEPDCRGDIQCEACREYDVFGAEELLITGKYRLDPE